MIEYLSLEDMLAIPHVKRWHMIKTAREQNLAEHSFMVAMLAIKLTALMPYGCVNKGVVMELALLHDVHETEFGDIPTPTKKYFEGLEADWLVHGMESAFWVTRNAMPPSSFASQKEANLVALADKLEAALFFEKEGHDEKIKARLFFDVATFAKTHFPAVHPLLDFINEACHTKELA